MIRLAANTVGDVVHVAIEAEQSSAAEVDAIVVAALSLRDRPRWRVVRDDGLMSATTFPAPIRGTDGWTTDLAEACLYSRQGAETIVSVLSHRGVRSSICFVGGD